MERSNIDVLLSRLENRQQNEILDNMIKDTLSYINQILRVSADYFLKGKENLGFVMFHEVLRHYMTSKICKESLLHVEEDDELSKNVYRCIELYTENKKEYVQLNNFKCLPN